MTEVSATDEQALAEAEKILPRRVAVITGASSGIGEATAIEFARNGFDLVLTARRERELRQVAELCEQQGARTVVVTADTSDETALREVANAAVTAYNGFDVWVNGAATSIYAKFEDIPEEDFRRLMDVNLFGYVHGCKIALEQFKLIGHGTLINISSINAVAPVPFAAAYVSSKYAVRGLTESIRMELELQGLGQRIHICNVMPSSMDTNFFQNAANYTGREIQAIEPVYDPSYVARQIVRLADEPRREIIVGPAGKMMAAERALVPALYERMVGKFINFNGFSTKPTERTTGNLYEPVDANSGMRGGWREKRVRADSLNLALGAAAAAVVGLIGAAYISRRRHAHD